MPDRPTAPRSSLGRRVALNAGSNWANLLVNTLVTLGLIPFMLDHLGRDAYGVWALLAFGLAYPVILERAFANAVVRFVAFHADAPEVRNRYVASALAVMAGLGVLTVLAAWAVSGVLADVFSAVPESMADEAGRTCVLVGLTLALWMLQAPYGGALKGEQRFVRFNAVGIGANVLRAVLIVWLLRRGGGIVSVQAAYATAAAASMLVMRWSAHRRVTGLSLSPGMIDRAHVAELWRFTRHAMARSGSRVVMLNTLALLVGWRGSAADVALYDIASKAPQFLNSLMNGAQNVLLPVVSGLWSRGDLGGIRSLARRTTTLYLSLTLAFTVWLLFDAEALLRFWLRRDLDPDLGLLVRLLVISLVPSGGFGQWLPILVGMDRLRALTAAAVSGSLAAIGLAWVLILRGVTVPFAPAWAMIVEFWIYRAVWLPWYGLRRAEQPAGPYLQIGVAPPVAAAVAAAMVLFGRRLVIGPATGLTGAILDGVVIAAAFLILALRGEARAILASRRIRLSRSGGSDSGSR